MASKQWGKIASNAGGIWTYPLAVSAAYALSAIGYSTTSTGAAYTYYKVFDTTHAEIVLPDRDTLFILLAKI